MNICSLSYLQNTQYFAHNLFSGVFFSVGKSRQMFTDSLVYMTQNRRQRAAINHGGQQTQVRKLDPTF